MSSAAAAPSVVPDHAIRSGDRVHVRHYGDGIVRAVERPARGTDIYWIEMDDAVLRRFGWHKTHAGNLTRI